MNHLKEHHRITDWIYWNLFAALPALIAGIAVARVSIAGLIFLIVAAAGLVGLIYRFFCIHCPHYTRDEKRLHCMFFWGVPKLFNADPDPLSGMEKLIAWGAPVILVLLPLYWLISQPALLMIYLLSVGIFLATVRRTECGRCVYRNCPANCVPDDVND